MDNQMVPPKVMRYFVRFTPVGNEKAVQEFPERLFHFPPEQIVQNIT